MGSPPWLKAGRAALLLASLVLGAPSLTALAAPPVKVAEREYPAQFRARVGKAIELGVNYLRTRQMRNWSAQMKADERERWLEVEFQEAAAVTWVLRRAAVPSSDDGLRAAARTYRSRAPATIESASLLLLALCSEVLPNGDPFTIGEPSKSSDTLRSLSAEDRSLVEHTAQFLIGRQSRRRDGLPPDLAESEAGGWGDVGDNSANVEHTYLALIALESAARCGVKVPASTWSDALRLLLTWQAPEGQSVLLRMNEVKSGSRWEWTEPAFQRGFGWTTSLSDSSSGYQTAAGAVGLVVCQDFLQGDPAFTIPLQQRTRSSIRDAIAWLQATYSITKNPTRGKQNTRGADEGPLYHHHWLQALARLALHSRMRYIGSHDWYKEGAELLLKTQGTDGSWHVIWWENCYALLFLLRASHTSFSPAVTTPSEPAVGK